MRIAVAAFAIASALVFVPATVRADQVTGSAAVVPASSQAEIGEARAQIDATLAQMRAISLRVREQLRTTRRRGTKHQITCVDEALSRSDVALRRARETGGEELAAYARSDTDAAHAAHRRLGEIHEAQRVAASEGSSCAPGPVQLTTNGVTTVRLDIDPRVASAP